MVIQTGDNLFGVCKIIVDPVAGLGTHTTITAAYTSASSGDTIAVRPGTYTENPTVKPGTTLVAYNGDQLNPNVTIVGTCTMTGAGTSSISNIRLQTNSAAAVAVTGSAASILNLNDCYLNFTNNTGITYSSSSSSSKLSLNNCYGDLGTTGIAYFDDSSAGVLTFTNSTLTNNGNSTTSSTSSAGSLVFRYSIISAPITTSSTCSLTAQHSNFLTTSTGAIALTHNSTAINCNAFLCLFSSGTGSGVSIGSGATLIMGDCNVQSANTNAVTGVGTLVNAGIFFSSTSSLINTTTQTARNLDVGGISFDGGTNTLSTYSSSTFTPGIAFGGSSTGITYSAQSGSYTKIGRMVFCKINLTLSSKGAQTGTATITGLPFTTETNTLLSILPIGATVLTLTANYTCPGIQVATNSTIATLVQFSNTGLTYAVVDNTMFANTTGIFANFFYFAAS